MNGLSAASAAVSAALESARAAAAPVPPAELEKSAAAVGTAGSGADGKAGGVGDPHRTHGSGSPPRTRAGRLFAFASLSFASLGVVFGDIGTSPLYSYSSLFQDEFGVQRVPTEEDVRGGLACLVWALVLCTTVKYQVFMMAANHQGEGGLFSLLNSLRWRGGMHTRPHTWRAFQAITIVGVALMTMDAILTSTVSVTSAIEGIGLAVPAFNGAADPAAYRNTNALSAAVLVLVFVLQAAGSQSIGLLYAPVMLAWLGFIAGTGAYNVAQHPSALRAWSPAQLGRFWNTGNYRGAAAWRSLGGVVLCLTGSEALYADMGHFGRGPIAAAWFFAVFPALVLQYTGQSAFLLRNIALLQPDPADGAVCAAAWADLVANGFWHSLPGARAYHAMLVVATLASIVGSQSVITGVFTLYSQAAGMGLCPAIEVRHTSNEHQGQVFCPGVNRVMAVIVLVIVGAFQHSSNLTAVFGACVGCAFLCDSSLRLGVAAYVHNWNWAAMLAVGVPLMVMDGALASANVARYFTAGPVLLGEGSANGRSAWIAYIPLILIVTGSTFMATWMWGRRNLLLEAARRTDTLLAVGHGLELHSAWVLDPALLQLQPPKKSKSLPDLTAPGRAPPNGSSDAAGAAHEPPSPPTPTPAGGPARGAPGSTAQPPVAELLSAALRQLPSAPSLAMLDADDGSDGGGGGAGTSGERSPSVGLSRVASFAVSFRLPRQHVVLSIADDTAAHEALGTTLHALGRAGALCRTPAVAVYIANTASLLDTEAFSHADARMAASGSAPLELPHAFLHAVQAAGALARLTIVLRFEFSELPKVPPGEQLRVHRVGLPRGADAPDGLTGVFLVTVRCGWADSPATSHFLAEQLMELGRSASAGCAGVAPELAALCHLRCWMGGGDSGCVCSELGAPRECLPVTFVASHDRLQPPAGAALPVRAAVSLFNAIAAHSGTFAEMLSLPPELVADLGTRVVAPAQRRSQRRTGAAPRDLPLRRAHQSWHDSVQSHARVTLARLRRRGALALPPRSPSKASSLNGEPTR